MGATNHHPTIITLTPSQIDALIQWAEENARLLAVDWERDLLEAAEGSEGQEQGEIMHGYRQHIQRGTTEGWMQDD